ncbi:hypothetical protein [Acidipropionibacterium acidipropionici]|uniref:hypothetical protein n=1 Tax=Acidipropionibacterium acidipropionici TaxID=1748 RepID=UPI001E2AB099|nr:hypothetical protein [Acidipropionibacterium acidipropionici]
MRRLRRAARTVIGARHSARTTRTAAAILQMMFHGSTSRSTRWRRARGSRRSTGLAEADGEELGTDVPAEGEAELLGTESGFSTLHAGALATAAVGSKRTQP